MRPGLTGLLLIFSLILAACSSTGSGYAPGDAPTGAAPSAAIPVTGSGNVRVANDPKLGQILVAPDGKTLYTNTVDTPDHLRCVDASCTVFWTPLTVTGAPTADQSIQASLGLVTRPDGSKQVTYKQQPLYTFTLDKQPGDVKGNGFVDFGGTWHIVNVGGSAGGAHQSSTPAPGNNSSGTPGSNYTMPGGIQY